MGVTNTHTARGFSDLYHVFARKQCILCPALRHGYLTLLYVTLIRDFFCPGTIAHGSIRLPPLSLASSRGCLLAVTSIMTKGSVTNGRVASTVKNSNDRLRKEIGGGGKDLSLRAKTKNNVAILNKSKVSNYLKR